MPRSIRSEIISSELLAGPIVQTIFARRRAEPRPRNGRSCDSNRFGFALCISGLIDSDALLLLGAKFRMRSEQEARITYGVEFRAYQHHHRYQVQPDQEGDGSSHRSVDDIVIRVAPQIPAEQHRGK